MKLWTTMAFTFLVPGKFFLVILAFHPSCAIVTKPLVFPSENGHQAVGIVTGPSSGSSDWSPSVSLNYYFNRECQTDGDCFPSRTLLYCISYRCQCIKGGATYLNGIFYNYNMQWSRTTAQCNSQIGSPCTLKQYWYSPSIVKMDCVQGHECAEVSTSAAKSTIAEQIATGYGSEVSAAQLQHYQSQPLSFYQHLQYFGSGVASLAGNVAPTTNGGYTGQRRLPQTQTATTAATDSTENQWGICVRREVKDNSVSATGELSVSTGIGTPNSATGNGSFSILSCAALSLSVVVLWCST